MTAAELIDKLQNVAPDTEIKVAAEHGSRPVREVALLGYYGGTALIVPED